MGRAIREGGGALLLLGALAVLYDGIAQLRVRDYLACVVLVLTGLSMMKASVELLRASIGE